MKTCYKFEIWGYITITYIHMKHHRHIYIYILLALLCIYITEIAIANSIKSTVILPILIDPYLVHLIVYLVV